ncbi:MULTISPECIES: hypothetical protein [Brucella]|uniref:Uncharacterized protein n=14 Tax=Brucella TaxID=234 RepID=Q2YN58_BRUA2|nr:MULTISPECIES: hypothetical protein [Brucella]AAN29640.1 hypothetical protein BR0711 [Brucella suis 1330]AAX74105.1 hypothetical protein BruAb1_0730 [Brucella abortus bv. 1 str. 9-941]ABX61797.1 Hypothetical protein, conserved [Brucella canis ATCC 23365]ABY37817.1 Hypothetical protein, conserved [Brucella suis ATCC 23445]ACD72216.1 hypothetical protein BAbS19_I06850 [Brucella abortus S19]
MRKIISAGQDCNLCRNCKPASLLCGGKSATTEISTDSCNLFRFSRPPALQDGPSRAIAR